MNTLWHSTRDLHHACEQNPVGAAMASGTPPQEWYAGWLQTLVQLHTAIDPQLPQTVHRASRVAHDLQQTGIKTSLNAATKKYTDSLTNSKRVLAAGYVLTGAHLMGGEIMRRRLQGYPTTHLEWDDRKKALVCMQELRDTPDIVQETRDCFSALLASMDEIQLVYPQSF